MDWFLYDKDHRQEKVKVVIQKKIELSAPDRRNFQVLQLEYKIYDSLTETRHSIVYCLAH